MDKIHFAEELQIGNYLVTVVNKITLNGHSNTRGMAVSIESQPLGILVQETDKQWAINVHGQRMTKDVLLLGYPLTD